MASADRPFVEVLSSIFGNFEDIVRSEIKLAQTEVREEIAKSARGASWIVTACVSAFFALAFLLVAIFFGLLFVLPGWAAALCVCVVLAMISITALQLRAHRVRQLTQRQDANAAATTNEEYLPWAKQATK